MWSFVIDVLNSQNPPQKTWYARIFPNYTWRSIICTASNDFNELLSHCVKSKCKLALCWRLFDCYQNQNKSFHILRIHGNSICVMVTPRFFFYRWNSHDIHNYHQFVSIAKRMFTYIDQKCLLHIVVYVFLIKWTNWSAFIVEINCD